MDKKILIIYKDKLKNLILTFKNRKKPNLKLETPIGFVFAILLSVLTTKEYSDFIGIPKETIKYLIYIIGTIGFLYIIFVAVYRLYHKKSENFLDYDLDLLENEIFKLTEHKTDNTLILLFARIKNGRLEFLVQRKDSWNNSYFFPYLDDDKGKDISEFLDNIKQKIISKYSIITVFNVWHLSELNLTSVKLTTENFPKTFNYRFLLIYPKSSFLKDALNEELKNFEYKTIDELLLDRLTIKYNEDVIVEIKENITTIERKLKNTIHSNTKIIWNFDKNCTKSCSFCAYGEIASSHPKLTMDEAKQLINSLKSVNIDCIDLATGDSPEITQLKEIISQIKSKLNVKLCLTTTSEVIEKIDVKFIKKNIDTVEITYDYPKNKNFDFRSKDYNNNNYRIAKDLIKQGVKIEALVVLHNKMKFKDIVEIKRDLKTLGIKKILLLRLMPVGKQSIDDYPEELFKRSTFEKTLNLYQICSDGVKLHCALQGIQDVKNPCEMGTNKLGISYNGDVYSCPWGEHLQGEANPFLIGNFINDALDLKSLLQGSINYQEIIQKTDLNQPHCKIFSYLKELDIYSKSDELYV